MFFIASIARRRSLTRSFQEVVIKPAGRDKHRVELHLNATFGGPETNRIIYVTDEIPAEEEDFFGSAKKSICSWLSCCCGLPDDSRRDSVGEGAKPVAGEPHCMTNAAGQEASVDDGASQHSRATRKTGVHVDAQLPPSLLIVETVNELKRVLDSVKEQQKHSDYASAKIAESSAALPHPQPPAAERSLTKAGIILPDVPRPKGPNSVRPRLPASLSVLSSSSDAVSVADASEPSPWDALTALEGGSQRAIPRTLSPAGGSFRGGSLAGNAFASVGLGSVSSVGNSVTSEFARPVFQRRAPTAARNAPAAIAAEPPPLSSGSSSSALRPPLVLSLGLTSAVPSPFAGFIAPLQDLSYTAAPRHAIPAPLTTTAFNDIRSQDPHAELRALRPLAAVASETHLPQAPSFTRHSVASPIPTVQYPTHPPSSLSAPAPASILPGVHDAPSQPSAKAEAVPFPAVASDTSVLERILSNVAAANLLPRFIDDLVDDGDLGALAITKPSKLQAKYGLNDSQIPAFIAGCQQAISSPVSSCSAHGDGHLRRDADASADSSSRPSDQPSADAVSSAAPSAPPLHAQTPRAPPPLPPLPSSFEQ
jgi:hypothetical protein